MGRLHEGRVAGEGTRISQEPFPSQMLCLTHTLPPTDIPTARTSLYHFTGKGTSIVTKLLLELSGKKL